MHGYPVWAEVDLDAIAHNCAEARRLIGPAGTILMVVKADGYGLGAIAVAHEAARHSVERFGVATLDEGVELRESGIDAPILMFTPSLEEEVESIVRYEIEPTIADLHVARAYGVACEMAGEIPEDINAAMLENRANTQIRGVIAGESFSVVGLEECQLVNR